MATLPRRVVTEADREWLRAMLGNSPLGSPATAPNPPTRQPINLVEIDFSDVEARATAMLAEAQIAEPRKAQGLPHDPKSRPFQRIVARGCIGERDGSGDFTCEYDWSCDHCPVTIARLAEERPGAGTIMYRFLTLRPKRLAALEEREAAKKSRLRRTKR